MEESFDATPGGEPERDYLRSLVEEGLRRRYGDPVPAAAIERADMELSVVDRMGFSAYFLIVWDFVTYAKANGIAVGPEHAQQVVRVGARVGLALLHDALAEPRLQAAGKRDHALRVAVQKLHVDVRLPAPEAFQVPQRGELDQVPEALTVPRQERQVVALVADLLALPAVVHEVGLEAQDRLHAVLAAGLVELKRAVQDAVVGEPQCRHPELRGASGERVDLAGAVEQRVLGMDVQVDGAGRAHGRQSRAGG